MRRTMQAMADLDLAFAERVMELAEAMAETHPRIVRDKEIDDLYLNPNRITREQIKTICGQDSAAEMQHLSGYTGKIAGNHVKVAAHMN